MLVASLHINTAPSEQALMVKAPPVNMELLHHWLGHISEWCICTSTGMAKIIMHRDSIEQCKVCICTKQTQAPISAGPTQCTETLMELVHSDLCRPLAETPGGHCYFMLFINNYMRYT